MYLKTYMDIFTNILKMVTTTVAPKDISPYHSSNLSHGPYENGKLILNICIHCTTKLALYVPQNMHKKIGCWQGKVIG